MRAHTAELHPDLVDWPDTQPVRGALVPVVNTLRDQDRVIATLGDLAELLPGRAPESIARALREAGWLFPMRTRGVWGFSGARLAAPSVAGYLELHARMRVRPDTPACIAGKTVAMLRGWLRRPVGPAIGMPPGEATPRCLSGYATHRWEPQIGLDELHGLPMWKPETLLCYMAARPSRLCWEDVSEWLWAVCENLDVDLLLAELERRPRAVWMKTGYLADVGERPDLGSALVAAAPSGGRGPYVLGWRERQLPAPVWESPVRLSRYEIVDYLLPTWWYPKVGFEPFEPPKTWERS
ncbi:MAG: hypothetical protein OXS29_18030 [bacterium]|nr:hypothetical protein [bacterium]MDE0290719.1 hypothetical protein [bacterium]MDE0437677.1 hypothetical protein [bacterium]